MTLNEDHADALRAAANRVEQAKAEFEQTKKDREQVIQDVALAGASYREIAAEAGMSHQRVHQLLTGEKELPKRPYESDLLFHCPKCGAKPNQGCVKEDGKPHGAVHGPRSHRAYNVLNEGIEEPRDDEPGPHTTLYQAREAMTLGSRSSGPIYLNPDDCAAYVQTLSEGSYVAYWAPGNKWEPAGDAPKRSSLPFPSSRLSPKEDS